MQFCRGLSYPSHIPPTVPAPLAKVPTLRSLHPAPPLTHPPIHPLFPSTHPPTSPHASTSSLHVSPTRSLLFNTTAAFDSTGPQIATALQRSFFARANLFHAIGFAGICQLASKLMASAADMSLAQREAASARSWFALLLSTGLILMGTSTAKWFTFAAATVAACPESLWRPMGNGENGAGLRSMAGVAALQILLFVAAFRCLRWYRKLCGLQWPRLQHVPSESRYVFTLRRRLWVLLRLQLLRVVAGEVLSTAVAFAAGCPATAAAAAATMSNNNGGGAMIAGDGATAVVNPSTILSSIIDGYALGINGAMHRAVLIGIGLTSVLEGWIYGIGYTAAATAAFAGLGIAHVVLAAIHTPPQLALPHTNFPSSTLGPKITPALAGGDGRAGMANADTGMLMQPSVLWQRTSLAFLAYSTALDVAFIVMAATFVIAKLGIKKSVAGISRALPENNVGSPSQQPQPHLQPQPRPQPQQHQDQDQHQDQHSTSMSHGVGIGDTRTPPPRAAPTADGGAPASTNGAGSALPTTISDLIVHARARRHTRGGARSYGIAVGLWVSVTFYYVLWLLEAAETATSGVGSPEDVAMGVNAALHANILYMVSATFLTPAFSWITGKPHAYAQGDVHARRGAFGYLYALLAWLALTELGALLGTTRQRHWRILASGAALKAVAALTTTVLYFLVEVSFEDSDDDSAGTADGAVEASASAPARARATAGGSAGTAAGVTAGVTVRVGAGVAAATDRVGGGSAGGPAGGTRPRETARPHLPFWSPGRRFALGSVLVCWVYGVVFAASVLVWHAPEEGGLVSDWYYGTPAEESRLHVHQRWKHRPYSVAYEFACKFTLLLPTLCM